MSFCEGGDDATLVDLSSFMTRRINENYRS